MSKSAYTKAALTYSEQLQQLKDRGLNIDNEEHFLHLLEVKSYYRLSGYWYPLLADKAEHIFKEGANFDIAYKIYCFDRELRHLVLAELEKIEVAIRAKMIYILSRKYGPFWYNDNELFKKESVFNQCQTKLEAEFDRSDEEFITAFKNKYSDPLPPSWILLEVSSFGSLSVMYGNLKSSMAKRDIAKYFGLADSVFSSWLHSIVYLRNTCAHHSRLWNRMISIQPLKPRRVDSDWLSDDEIPNNTTFYILSSLIYLMNHVKYENDIVTKVRFLLAKYSNIDPKAMGFPENWEVEPLWME